MAQLQGRMNMADGGETKPQTIGVNHIALQCKNMAKTTHFYRDILCFPLVKTVEIPPGVGPLSGMQHFFFDTGHKTLLAFLWFPNAPEAVPGVSSAPVGGGFSAHGSMNHLAFNVAPEMLEVYRQRLLDNDIEVSPIINHDDSEQSVSPEINETTYVRSIYFTDPDGIRLEMAAWMRDLTPDDVTHLPAEQDSVPAPSAATDKKTPEKVS